MPQPTMPTFIMLLRSDLFRQVRDQTLSASVELRRAMAFLLPPSPAADERMILAAFVDVLAVFDERVADGLLGVGGARAELRQAIDHILHQMETVHLVQHDHIERRRGRAFLLVAAHMKVLVVSCGDRSADG